MGLVILIIQEEEMPRFRELSLFSEYETATPRSIKMGSGCRPGGLRNNITPDSHDFTFEHMRVTLEKYCYAIVVIVYKIIIDD